MADKNAKDPKKTKGSPSPGKGEETLTAETEKVSKTANVGEVEEAGAGKKSATVSNVDSTIAAEEEPIDDAKQPEEMLSTPDKNDSKITTSGPDTAEKGEASTMKVAATQEKSKTETNSVAGTPSSIPDAPTAEKTSLGAADSSVAVANTKTSTSIKSETVAVANTKTSTSIKSETVAVANTKTSTSIKSETVAAPDKSKTNSTTKSDVKESEEPGTTGSTIVRTPAEDTAASDTVVKTPAAADTVVKSNVSVPSERVVGPAKSNATEPPTTNPPAEELPSKNPSKIEPQPESPAAVVETPTDNPPAQESPKEENPPTEESDAKEPEEPAAVTVEDKSEINSKNPTETDPPKTSVTSKPGDAPKKETPKTQPNKSENPQQKKIWKP